jgi:amidase
MTPTLALSPAKLGTLSPRKSYDEMRDLLARYVAYTPIENAAGACAISLPMGFAGGLPIGIQFVARPGGERVLLELAYELENAIGWHRMRPQVWVG